MPPSGDVPHQQNSAGGRATTPSLVLAGATLVDGSVVDVRVEGDLIEGVGAPDTLAPAAERADLSGFLLLPAPAEPHAHLDTALIGRQAPNRTGDLSGAIAAWLAYQSSASHDDFVRRATAAALMGLTNGATALRSHVGIFGEGGLRAAEALIEVRERLRGDLDLQLVAFALQLTGLAGADTRARLRAALEMGFDVVGGCPYRDPDPITCHEIVLATAAEFGRPIDLHTDETLEPGTLYLPDFVQRVAASGFPYGATASHCVSLAIQPPDVIRGVAEQVAAAGVAVICNPQTNLFLQARDHATGPPRGLTAVRQLLDAGAVVAGGGDDLRNPFNPVGRADPLETASLLVTAAHLTIDEAYSAVSAGARAAMGLPQVAIEPGRPAELLAVGAPWLADALAGGSDRLVIHRGRIVSRTTISRELLIEPASAIEETR